MQEMLANRLPLYIYCMNSLSSSLPTFFSSRWLNQWLSRQKKNGKGKIKQSREERGRLPEKRNYVKDLEVEIENA